LTNTLRLRLPCHHVPPAGAKSPFYEVRNLVTTASSLDCAGNVVNPVKRVYNGFQQLTREHQEHGGAVVAASTPLAQCGNANGSANTIRPTSLTPGERWIQRTAECLGIEAPLRPRGRPKKTKKVECPLFLFGWFRGVATNRSGR
jgi:hypothetical protein